MSKYRAEIDISFVNEVDANAFLNYIESIKTIPYTPTGLEPIEVGRKCKKSLESYDGNVPTGIVDVDFNGVEITH